MRTAVTLLALHYGRIILGIRTVTSAKIQHNRLLLLLLYADAYIYCSSTTAQCSSNTHASIQRYNCLVKDHTHIAAARHTTLQHDCILLNISECCAHLGASDSSIGLSPVCIGVSATLYSLIVRAIVILLASLLNPTSISFLGFKFLWKYLQHAIGFGSTTPAVYTACLV
jgi:hypothetical protein